MQEIIFDMVLDAQIHKDYEMLEHVKKIIDTFTSTINCPSNWRSIGEALVAGYFDGAINDWTYENLKLYEYE